MLPRRLAITVLTLVLLLLVFPGGCSREYEPFAPDVSAPPLPAALEMSPPVEPARAHGLDMIPRFRHRCFRQPGDTVINLWALIKPATAQPAIRPEEDLVR